MRKFSLLLSLFAVMMVTAIKSYSQITVTSTVGTSPLTYPTLRNAINAINGGVHGGVIGIAVTASTAETIASVLNASGVGAASYTSILIKPAPTTTPTISGSFATAILQLVGADNVTIDGSNTIGGTTRDLTITNNSPSTSASVIWISSATAANGATNDTVKNCRITGFSATTTAGGVITGDNALAGNPAAAPNSNNGIVNNLFMNTQNGIYLYGAAANDAGWLISKNNFSTLSFRGMIVMNTTDATISENAINGVTGAVGVGQFVTGIMLYNGTNNANVFKNVITGINATNVNGGCSGITLLGNVGTNNNIFNNFVSNVWATNGNAASAGQADNGYGIYVGPVTTNASYNIYFNTVRMITPQLTGLVNAAINIATGMSAGSVNLQDNIFGNEQTAGATIRAAIYSSATTGAAFATINYNDYYAPTGTLGYINSIACGTIPLIQTNFGGNLNSIDYTPTYAAAPPDLHLSQTVAANYTNLKTGTPIATPPITTDIDNVNRNVTTPTMGAHELLLDTIMYTPLAAGTCATGDVTLNPVTIIAPAGVPTTGALMPRIYFKKNAGPWFSNAGTLVTGTGVMGTWSFVISAAAMGGVLGGDVISYYVVAQDLVPAPLGPIVFAYPGAGMVATDVNTITTPPTTPLTYTVNAVSLAGLNPSSSVCFNATTPTTALFTFTSAPGAPNEYMLTWAPTGPADVTVFSPFAASPLIVGVPPATAVGTYTGTLTIRNLATTCVNTHTLTLTINPLPNPIAGFGVTCTGLSTILTNTSPGGTWSSGSPTIATIGVTSGVVNGVTAGTAVMTYTLLTGCYTTTIVTVNPQPAAITGPTVVCQTSTITLANPVSGGSWGSSTPLKAIVDAATGVVTGVDGGVATITYNLVGCNAVSKLVTVNPLPLLITGPLNVCQGFNVTLSSGTPGGTWSSSLGAVATVGSSTGIVTGVTTGTANITYTLPTTCMRVVTVTVNANPSTTTPTGPVYVCQGLTTNLTNVTPGGTWVSQFPGVASVNAVTGAVTGVTAGSSSMISYIVTATGCYATKAVTVTAPPSAISGPNVFCANSTAILLNLTPGGTWTTSNAAVATVGPISPVQGAVNGASNAGGTATIAYTTLACNPVSHPVTLTLSPSIISGPTNVCVGTMTALGNTVPGGTWSSSNPTVVPVSPGGVVTGLTAGVTATITYALSNGCYTVAPIVVDNPPAPISGPDSLCQLDTATFTDVTPGGLWSSSVGSIATIVAATGHLTAVSPGTVTLSYSLVSGCYATKQFKVRNPLISSVTFATTPNIDSVILCNGSSLSFTATPVNGGATPSYEWVRFGTTVLASGPSNTFSYVPVHGDFITVRMHRDPALCALPDPATYSKFINVHPLVSPSITISTPTTVLTYFGQVFTFTSSVTNVGTSPTYQWYQNGLIIPGATNNTYSTPLYGAASFLCAITGNPDCAITTTASSNNIYISKQIVGVQSLAANNELSVSPNPNTGSFILAGSSAEKELDLEITNMLGQVVFRGKTSPQNGVVNEPITLKSDIAAGTYILRVHSDSTNGIFHFVVNK